MLSRHFTYKQKCQQCNGGVNITYSQNQCGLVKQKFSSEPKYWTCFFLSIGGTRGKNQNLTKMNMPIDLIVVQIYVSLIQSDEPMTKE